MYNDQCSITNVQVNQQPRTDRLPKQKGKMQVTAFINIADILNWENQSGALFQPLTGQVYYDGLAIFPSFGVKVEF